MDVQEMDLKDYCGLNRPRFRLDPESDGAWYFGNQAVCEELINRVTSDFLIRGVPKCGVVGRFGMGKTHTLYHLKYLFEENPRKYPAKPFVLRIAPYDESTSGLGGWSYIHSKMLDAMGEKYLREMVRTFDQLPYNRAGGLEDALTKVFKFGPENLQRSLAAVLSAYFLREGKPTMPAWNWLRGQKLSGRELPDVGVTVWLEHAGDMIDIILNLGALSRKTWGLGMCFLMDEGQALNEVQKREVEIHDAFLQIAEPENDDVGFVLAFFGTGARTVPQVITEPDDILSRLGATNLNLQEAFIDLRRIVDTENDLKDFIRSFLSHIRESENAAGIIRQFKLEGITDAELLPFDTQAIDRIAKLLHQNETLRNPRMIIDCLARVAAESYQRAKAQSKYVIADVSLVNQVLIALA